MRKIDPLRATDLADMLWLLEEAGRMLRSGESTVKDQCSIGIRCNLFAVKLRLFLDNQHLSLGN